MIRPNKKQTNKQNILVSGDCTHCFKTGLFIASPPPPPKVFADLLTVIFSIFWKTKTKTKQNKKKKTKIGWWGGNGCRGFCIKTKTITKTNKNKKTKQNKTKTPNQTKQNKKTHFTKLFFSHFFWEKMFFFFLFFNFGLSLHCFLLQNKTYLDLMTKSSYKLLLLRKTWWWHSSEPLQGWPTCQGQ